MGNLIELPNINPESIVFDGKSQKKSGNFDLKNYLNVRLGKDEKEKTITIRLLPMDLKTGNPFVKIHVHNVQVPKDLVGEGAKPFKDYICLAKTEDIDHEKYGHKCPFCEINNSAYKEAEKATDPVVKKSWQDISIANKRKEAVILRCIERGKENEGVKFWKFKLRDDKTDPYNQILKLYQLRKEEGEAAGKVVNILDIYNGRDLKITITSEGTSAPQILDVSIETPLSRDEEQMKKWIYDEKKWQDVFTCKTYEYLSLVSQMKTPWYDKDKDLWVDKEVYNKEHGVETAKDKEKKAEEINNQLKAVEVAIKSEPSAKSPMDEERRASAEKSAEEAKKSAQSFAASITVNDDDLPF